MKGNTKSQPISIEQVWAAYREVRKHGKASGVDGLTKKVYEEIKSKELYKVWNRMASGSYYPPPVRRVEIPKSDGEKRKLGIPTINDRVAQTVVKHYLEPKLEPHFHENSFGYRPNRNAHQALAQAEREHKKKAWVLDLDIKGFFDHLRHDLMMLALQRHTQEKWVLMYIERWLKAPVEQSDGRKTYPSQGSPQGGVISPLLSNLYLHYAFDEWMRIHYEAVVFERYADDIVVHCNSYQEAEKLLGAIRRRLLECGLELHPEKTKIVYCKDSNRKGDYETVSYEFLGIRFQPHAAKNRKTGKLFTTFGPADISSKTKEKILETIRSQQIKKRMTCTLTELTKLLEPHVRGWMNYFGRIKKRLLHEVMRYINGLLLQWAVKRYKRFKGRIREARNWLKEIIMIIQTCFYIGNMDLNHNSID